MGFILFNDIRTTNSIYLIASFNCCAFLVGPKCREHFLFFILEKWSLAIARTFFRRKGTPMVCDQKEVIFRKYVRRPAIHIHHINIRGVEHMVWEANPPIMPTSQLPSPRMLSSAIYYDSISNDVKTKTCHFFRPNDPSSNLGSAS